MITVLQTTGGAQDHATVSLDVIRSEVIDTRLARIRERKFDRRARGAIIRTRAASGDCWRRGATRALRRHGKA